MTIHNIEVAAIFNKLADLLEITNDNPFRIRAYRNAARIVGSLPQDIAILVENNEDLTQFPGIGKDLAEKIKTIVNMEDLPILKKMEKKVPPVLIELLKIEGLGPKRVQILYKKLKVKNLDDLKKSILSGKVKKIKGFGDKIMDKILSGIENIKKNTQRIKWADSLPIVDSIKKYLSHFKKVQQTECAGSFRRKKETLGDIDFVVSSNDNKNVIRHFVQFDEINSILSEGDTRSSVRLHSGIQVDLRCVPPESYGAALLYFTGSKAHNISIRKMAQKMGLKVNEYGIFKGKKQIAGRTEEEMYHQLGLSYVEPELREDMGELELAKKNKLPNLITLNTIRGDLHCHTDKTDGDASIQMMVEQAIKLNYSYIAITDHTKHLTIAHGLTEKSLLAQIKLIDKLNSTLKNITILKSAEVDILKNGTLDLSNNILKELDFTVCAIHSSFGLTKKQQTERLLRAMDNSYFNILAHPTGRLINKRLPYEIDIEKIMLAAKERKCILELNAQPERMDLNDIHCKMAKDFGVKIAISSDAHSTSQMKYMQFGINQARRGWLERDDVINTFSLAKLRQVFRRH